MAEDAARTRRREPANQSDQRLDLATNSVRSGRRLAIRGRKPGSLYFDVVQHHRRQNHPGNSHEALPDNESQQSQPDRVLNPISNDFAVEKIFKLMQRDE